MPVNKAPRRLFWAVRMPIIILLFLALLLGLAYGGWFFYHHSPYLDRAESIRRGMSEHIAGLESYHARFKTIPLGQAGDPTYCVEFWKEPPHYYRIEMSSSGEDQPGELQVIIGHRDGVYFYDRSSAGFIPLEQPAEVEISATFLEDYWRSISEAAVFDYVGEQKGARHRYYQVEVIPSEPHRYRVSERVWLEQGSFLPVRVESFDAAGRLTQVTVFELLQLNPALEAALFEVESSPSAVPKR